MSVTTPELIAAQWRKRTAKWLIDMAGMLAVGSPLIGSPLDTEVTNVYGLVVAFVGPDGVVVGSTGVRTREDVRRVERAVRGSFDPEGEQRHRDWEAAEQAKVDAYMARPFACERGGHCTDRFQTRGGLASHLAHANRAGQRDYRHQDSGLIAPATAPRPTLTLATRPEEG